MAAGGGDDLMSVHKTPQGVGSKNSFMTARIEERIIIIYIHHDFSEENQEIAIIGLKCFVFFFL